MNNLQIQSKGMVLTCNHDLTIEQIVITGLDIHPQDLEGSNLTDLVIPSDQEKAEHFGNLVAANDTQHQWELNLCLNEKIRTFVFSGTKFEDQLILIGGYNNDEIVSLFEEMMTINNEQVNFFRSKIKAMSEAMRNQADQDNDYLNEMSRLNNELANLQRRLFKQNVELEELNELKNQFLGIAAHDLRNPLGNIYNIAEFLEDESENLPEEQVEFVQMIKTLSQFMLNLVNDLLDYSAIESGKINLSLTPVDLVKVIQQNLLFNQSLAKRKGIQLVFNTSMDSVFLYVDQGKIEQVLNNLLSNAIKYSHVGTKISVNVTTIDEEVLVAVKDQGQGIPEEEIELLFKPFQKTSTKSTTGEKSTGLGLFIVKNIIEAHKGQIWVESQVGKGSTFYFNLPNK